VGKHPLVARFMKCARRVCPGSKQFAPSWDLSVVLDALCQQPFEPLDQVELKMLSFKTRLLLVFPLSWKIFTPSLSRTSTAAYGVSSMRSAHLHGQDQGV
jgi:hypothetical protein